MDPKKTLKDYFNNIAAGFTERKQTLPNGGGTYYTPVPNKLMSVAPDQYSGGMSVAPRTYNSQNMPLLEATARPTFPETATPPPQTPPATTEVPAKTSTSSTSIFKPTGGTTASAQPTGLDYSKYLNPATGQPYTPQEYADMIARRASGGVVPNYAGDALTNPDLSASELESESRRINNLRNDMATGTTDPYKVASKSGIQYSPAQLNAIEKAYAGIYDPALEDVFTRLKEKQRKDEEIASMERSKELERFRTDENIRQYKSTTALGGGGSGSAAPLGLERGTDGYVDPYAYMQKAYEAENKAGGMKKFLSDYPPSNYINPEALNLTNPDGSKLIPSYLTPKQDTQTGIEIDKEIWQELGNPANAGLSDEDKYYFITSKGRNPESFGIYFVPTGQ